MHWIYISSSFVNVSAYDIFRDENITITMTVPDDATGNISVKIGNKSYNIPIKEGKANLTLSNLTPGMYSINATYAGDDYYSGSSNGTVSFKVKTRNTIISQDGVRAYNSGVDYEVKFTDELDRPLANTEVTLIVDGKTYKLKTDENGPVKFNEKMSVGNHTIDVVNPVTGESLQSSFSIVKRLEETEEVKQKGYTLMDFKDGSYYVVRVIGDDGNPDGFDIAFIKAVGEKLELQVKIQDMEFNSLVASVGNKTDVAIAGMTITDERKRAVDFSNPYYDAVQYVLVRKGSNIRNIDDLYGVNLAAQIGTTGNLLADNIVLKWNSISL